MTRLPFDQFLNASSGPSTPRGRGGARGRGRGRGGGGGGGGGFGGGTPGAGGPGRSFKTDYSNVPFDYTSINKQKYTKMDGFNVMPFASDSPHSTPRGRGRGASTGAGGRGRGGGLGSNRGDQQHQQDSSGQATPSRGSATPVHGLGYHAAGPGSGPGLRGRGGKESVPGSGLGLGMRTPVRVESTVGRGIGTGEVVWGGRKGAPMFVKAGELFKDGEVDVITAEEDKAIDVDSAVAAVESGKEDAPGEEVGETLKAGRTSPGESIALPEQPAGLSSQMEQLSVDPPMSKAPSPAPIHQDDPIITEDTAMNIDEGSKPAGVTVHIDLVGTRAPPAQSDNADSPSQLDQTGREAAAEEVDLDLPEILLDTQPQTVFPQSNTLYTSHLFPPIGGASSSKQNSDEEEIVFQPRKYKQPRPISVEVGPVPTHKPVERVPSPSAPIQAFIDPRANKPVIKRKDKKAAKKEKKKGRASGGKRAGRREDLGVEDDIDWGSDGPPAGLLRVEGLEMEVLARDEDIDMAILRDYMEGTKLAAQDDSEDSESDGHQEGEKGKGKEKLVKGRDKKKRVATGWEDPPVQAPAVLGETDEAEEEGDWEDDDGDTGDGDVAAEDEGDGESDESSELGDLQAIMDALDSDDDEDDDEEELDMDALFAGKNTWTSEDEGDWIIKSMEEALGMGPAVPRGNGKKGKKNLFSSIQNGDFDMDLPTTPVKKGKKKAQGIPEALQAQWEADRQKKAFKKEQRQLERLIADIEGVRPPSSTSRRKAKGASKAQQASLAHLIPASASEVADMFDVDSDDERAMAGRGMGKMRKMLNLPPQPGMGGLGDLEGIVRHVRAFVDDPGRTTLSLQPMEKEARQRMHLLADCFGLKSNSKGKGRARFTIFIKTSRTGLYVDESRIDRLISASSYTGGHFYKALYSKGGGGGGKGKDKGDKMKKGPGDRGTSGRAREGELVGEGAERIGESNMGHKLLSMMGWAEGGRIGRTDGGLTNPIVAVVKNTKMGLGA